MKPNIRIETNPNDSKYRRAVLEFDDGSQWADIWQDGKISDSELKRLACEFFLLNRESCAVNGIKAGLSLQPLVLPEGRPAIIGTETATNNTKFEFTVLPVLSRDRMKFLVCIRRVGAPWGKFLIPLEHNYDRAVRELVEYIGVAHGFNWIDPVAVKTYAKILSDKEAAGPSEAEVFYTDLANKIKTLKGRKSWVEIILDERPISVKATVYGHLALRKWGEANFTVTHVPTGRYIAKDVPDLQTAKMIVYVLKDLPWDLSDHTKKPKGLSHVPAVVRAILARQLPLTEGNAHE